MHRVNFLGYRMPVPSHPILRMLLGIMLICGGFLGFLPVLGFWMLPLGLLVLSIDFPMVRRFRRRTTVKLGTWIKRRWPTMAARLGFNPGREANVQSQDGV